MSFKAWARANAPKAYKPPKQPPKNTGPILPVETTPTAEFQPGDYIHYVDPWGETRYGIFIRYSGNNVYAYFGSTPQESEQTYFETRTQRTNVRSGWPDNQRNHAIEPVALADELDEWGVL